MCVLDRDSSGQRAYRTLWRALAIEAEQVTLIYCAVSKSEALDENTQFHRTPQRV
jgi:hypothetical protein